MSVRKLIFICVFPYGIHYLCSYFMREHYLAFGFSLVTFFLLLIAAQIEGFFEWQKKRLKEIEDRTEWRLENISDRLIKVEENTKV